MAFEHTSERRVEFSETDMAGLVHFSNFFRYMETAERDFFEACGLDLINISPGSLVGWPRGRADCKFFAPIRFGDRIQIHLAVEAVKPRSIDYLFRIYVLQEDGSRIHAAKGHLSTIYATLDPEDGSLRATDLTPEILAAIQPAPAAVLKRPQSA